MQLEEGRREREGGGGRGGERAGEVVDLVEVQTGVGWCGGELQSSHPSFSSSPFPPSSPLPSIQSEPEDFSVRYQPWWGVGACVIALTISLLPAHTKH